MLRPVSLFLCSLIFLPLISSAATAKHWWMAIEGGYAAPATNTRTVSEPMPNGGTPLFDDYTTTQRKNDFSLGIGAGLSVMQPLMVSHPQWFATQRLGLLVNHYTPTTVQGSIYVLQQTPASIAYQYTIISNVLWLDAQTDIYNGFALVPYVDFAIGGASSNSSHYSETTLIPPPSSSAAFANHTTTAFAWRIGLGVNYTVLMRNHHSFTVGAVYRRSDLGTAATGGSTTYATATNPLQQHLVNNEAVLTGRINF